MDRKLHWDKAYAAGAPERLGWHRPHLSASLELIECTGIDKKARFIDVGGGASTLVDDLLNRRFEEITVFDLSITALSLAQSRLGGRASKVTWIEGDITSVELPPAHYDLWHDRAVFHFLTAADDRRSYMQQLKRSLTPGGHVVLGVFSLDAPPRCSGLDVQRYSVELLQREIGADFALREHRLEEHVTPGGVKQIYLYGRFQACFSRPGEEVLR
jgi:SAM-dependent methyltransferase